MLRELHIANLAVIEDAAIELGPGLNVFTGQTGAGKSLVLGAFEALLGLKRSPARMIRPGAEQARITGVFEIPDAATAERVGLALDQDLMPGDELLITRKLSAAGRSTVHVNGQPATAAMVRAAAEHLVDIHGQHDHQYLLKPTNQLTVLDTFAGCEQDRHAFAQGFAELRRLRETKQELTATRALREQQLDLYRFQRDEIDAAEPVAGEVIELQARERVLGNLKKITQDAGACYGALYDAEGSVAERLQAVTQVLLSLSELDPALEETAEQVRAATLSLQESSFELSRYLNRLDLDPEELVEIESRLNTLNRLIQKYAGDRLRKGDVARGAQREAAGDAQRDALAPVLAYREQIGKEIETLERQGEDLDELDDRIAALADSLNAIADRLTAARSASGQALTPLVQEHLKDLGMPDARLRVELTRLNLDDEDAGPSGLDHIELMARTNPGQAERPLREIASGGELSRIMLAIKSVLARPAATPGKAGAKKKPQPAGASPGGVSVLVFDEIDANIGGRLGHVIGTKLRALAMGQPVSRSKKKAAPTGQVICITHLPQIAAFADRHLHIVKQVTGKGKTRQTATTVNVLEGDRRVDELAEMLAGEKLTATNRKQARELLAAAG
ncbi:MAG: DNA repair protein RecN [Phycisphaerales bacterium JB063]